MSFIENMDSQYFTMAAVLFGTIMMMKFLPRLMAGVPFVEAKAIHELMQSGKDVLIIDVRTEGEFVGNLGHVGGALNISAADLAKRLASGGGEFDGLKSEAVFVTCRTENRSPKAARALTKAGFTNVCVIKGGMAAWNRQGLPIEK